MEEHTTLQCIGFIMDGNRRWAKAQNKHTLEGHKKGAEVFFDVVSYVRDHNIPHGVFYAFSSENWNRSEEEVSYLLKLFSEYCDTILKKIEKEEESKRVRFRFIGDTSKFSQALQDKIDTIEEQTRPYTQTTIWIALSYGGRDEIVHAVNDALKAGEEVIEDTFRSFLWSGEMPDIDLIIRTGGQQRLSNFMTWHSVYSEFIFLDAFWPDLTPELIDSTLNEFYERNRNFGK